MSEKKKKTRTFCEIEFQPIGLRAKIPSSLSILECARLAGVDLVNLCGGNGKCLKCIVRIIEGHLTPPTKIEKDNLPLEQIAKGFRLACMTKPLSDVKIEIPPESLTTPQRVQIENIESTAEPDPLIKIYDIKLSAPNSLDQRSDYRRLIDGMIEKCEINNITIRHEVLNELPAYLRGNDWEAHLVLRENEIIGLVGRDTKPLGLAIDIGTTKIAAYLVDLYNGRTLESKGEMNPQISYGEDIISRLVYAQVSQENALRLQRLLIETLNQMIKNLCKEAGVSSMDIFESVVVCNTAIHHLFLNIPTESLSLAPYVPVIDCAMDLKASKLGMKTAPGAYVHVLPNIAGYVGADHVGMLLAVGIHQKSGVRLALDIGTNTEISLSNRGRLSSLSCASGPAFEGGHIKFGMRASGGAIERLKIENGTIKFQTIGGKPPIGLCGSGILDAFSEMYKAGALEKNGRMSAKHPLIIESNGIKEMLLVKRESIVPESKNITFSQKDVREIQLAKGAIRTGIDVLLKVNGLCSNDIDQVIISGAFGSYIDIASAKTVGMLPDLPSDRFIQVGNAAGLGSKLALISRSKREEAIQIAQQITYIEIATFPDFSKMFADAMCLN